MIKIGDKECRTMQEQVYKNMDDINELSKYLKEAYKCSGELNTASISIAKSLTNADASVKEGWLLDTVGSLFKITGGDDDSLLIEFYTSLRGPQGESGASVSIDDNTTSATKCWSSQKVNGELADIVNDYIDKGTYYTNTQPTDDTTIDSSALLNKNGYVPIQEKDLIIYIDGNNNPTSIYMVYSISGTTITVTKLGDYAKGKQLYEHNISITESGWPAEINVFITNDSATPMTLNDLKSWLNEKGFNSGTSLYKKLSGYFATTSTPQKYIVGGLKGIFNNNGTIRLVYMEYSLSWGEVGQNLTTFIEDNVIEL